MEGYLRSEKPLIAHLGSLDSFSACLDHASRAASGRVRQPKRRGMMDQKVSTRSAAAIRCAATRGEMNVAFFPCKSDSATPRAVEQPPQT